MEEREFFRRERFQAEQMGKEKQKVTKESPTTTTSTAKVWGAGSGLSLFEVVAKKKQREDGVVFKQVGQWKVNNPGFFKWTDSRNKHEYNSLWRMLEKVTDDGLVQQMVQRMAELVIWN
jgi:hypothetical protein